jgi:nucleoside-diphosphate-sugar epimerase
MRILVTDGAGFIGSHLVDRFVIDEYGVRVVDNLSSSRVENIKHHLGSRSYLITQQSWRSSGMGSRLGAVYSYIYIDDAVEATIVAWRRTEASYEVCNIASEAG